jgi:hypothetical protein
MAGNGKPAYGENRRETMIEISKLTEKEKDKGRKKEKKKKPWKLCTWYPDQCDAVGCDLRGYPCRDYKQEETW